MERIAVFKNPTSQISESYRSLCTNALAKLEDKKILEVAGIAEDTTASLVIANLAVALAQTGKKVLIIDCNLRGPKQHELFELNNNGLTDCIGASENYNTFVQPTVQKNLFVLAAGSTTPDNPVETLLCPEMDNILRETKDSYDVVLLDVTPVDTVSDAVALGTKTDGVLLVFTNKKDKVKKAQKAKGGYLRAGVPVFGCVLDKFGAENIM